MEQQDKARVFLSSQARRLLLADVHKRAHIEACGLLLGTIDESGNWQVAEAYPMRNTHDSPVYFEFDPADLLAADLAYPDQVIGAYHSHPTGLAVASSTDRQNMQRVNIEQQIPWVWLIISGPFDRPPSFFQQVQRRLAHVPPSAFVAYHHYEREGLQRVAIQFEEGEEDALPGEVS